MYHGDIRLGDTIDIKFTTVNGSGVPTQLAGSPVISAYVGNGTTEITAGITLTVDFDARTGLNNVRVVATSGNGFATATNVQLVITTGTVSGASVVGYVVGTFSIEARSALMPTVAARTLGVEASGKSTGVVLADTVTTYTGNTPQTGDNFARLGAPAGASIAADIATRASPTNITAGTITTVTNLTNSPTAGDFTATMKTSVENAVLNADMTGHQTQGSLGQAIGDPAADTNTIYKAVVTDAAGATVGVDVVAVKADTAAILVDTGTTLDGRIPAALVSGRMDSSVGAMATDVLTNTALAASAVTEIQAGLATPTNITAGTITTVTNLTNAPTSGDLTATMKTSVNAEVLDVLNVDTFAEIGQEAPSATQTIRKMLAYIYKAWRNRTTQSATQYSLYNDDASTIAQKATFSDDGTTAERTEITTGP